MEEDPGGGDEVDLPFADECCLEGLAEVQVGENGLREGGHRTDKREKNREEYIHRIH